MGSAKYAESGFAAPMDLHPTRFVMDVNEMRGSGFSKALLKSAQEAAGIGCSLDPQRSDSEAHTLDRLYEISQQTTPSDVDLEWLNYVLHPRRGLELFIEHLFRGTPGYVAFLDVWLVDDAKGECRKRYIHAYRKREKYSAYAAVAMVVLFIGFVFGLGILVAKWWL